MRSEHPGDQRLRELTRRLGRESPRPSDRLGRLFERIEPELYRYPAIDPQSFRRRVEEAVAE